MINLMVARGSRPTGRILTTLLQQANLTIGERAQGVVSYGVRYTGNLPALNAMAGSMDKMEQARALARANVRTIEVLTPAQAEAAMRRHATVMLGRHRNHVGGTDITLALQPEDVGMRVRAGAEFFTPYIPSRTEYRVWAYRRQHLGTYQKVLAHPTRYRKVGRNYDNGFAFQLVQSERVPRAAVELASAAVTALNLDFGAVDILEGSDGNFYVLEVNTAPGVEGEGRQVIQALARKIARWAELGYPARNGTEEAAARRTQRTPARRGR